MIPIERFKQIHNLNHSNEEALKEHLPFRALEAGFDDNKFELIYRTVYFQVKSHEQESFTKIMHQDSVLSKEERAWKVEKQKHI